MFIWQLNVIRAQFVNEDLATYERLYWKIEYGSLHNSAGKTREFTPATRNRKAVWNYFTEIRDNKATSVLKFSLFSKTARDGKALGRFVINLEVLRRKPDIEMENWYAIEDAGGSRVVGKLHMEITFKSFVIDAQSKNLDCGGCMMPEGCAAM
jgi:hypothetical protein